MRCWARGRFVLFIFFVLFAPSCTPRTEAPVERVIIPSGSSLSDVVDSLAVHRLVRWRRGFTLLARIGRFDRSIKPGLYAFGRGTSSLGMLRALTNGDYVTVHFTVPEGFTVTDIAALAYDELLIPRDSVLSAARDTAFLRQLGIGVGSVEGFLWPETYLISGPLSARELLARMVEQFNQAWDPAWEAPLRSTGWSRQQLLTLASIVEGEARADDERPVIAAVYLNRLRIGMALQADPTVQYAIQLRSGERKPRLYQKDYAVESPYNTYLHSGLPPGPVGSPGRASIEAVLRPARVPYLYFVAGPSGRHIFSRTYDEHLRAVARSRQGR